MNGRAAIDGSMTQRLTQTMQKFLSRAGLVFALVGSVTIAALSSLHATPAARQIGFDDLMRIYASSNDEMATDQQGIELTGYMLPADRDGDLVYEFMLFSQPGGCSHVAPPPPGQIVRVIPDQPFKAERMYQSVRVTGTLLTESNKAQLYVLDGVRIVESGFRISSAAVEGVSVAPPALPRTGKSPWKFLNN